MGSPKMRKYTFTAQIWKYTGENAWYFVTLPEDIAEEIKALTALHLLARRGFASLRVVVTIGTSTWDTSIFPDKKTASFLLPIKKSVRTANKLSDASIVAIELVVIDI